MKKALCCFLIVLFVCSVLSGCAEKPADAWYVVCSDPFIVCYGKFGEYGVWFRNGPAAALTTEEVAGYQFHFGSSFTISVEKDSEKYDLKEAYEKGILTKDDIEKIYRSHKAFVLQNYSGISYLYTE